MSSSNTGQGVVVQLSIVIPTFNEADRIGATLDTVLAYIATLPFASEVVVVDDGSSDQTTSIVRTRMRDVAHFALFEMRRNHGKGAAVCKGMLCARGAWRLFMDADSSTSIEQFERLRPFLQAGIPVVVGSRTAHGALIARPQPPLRRLAGWIFRTTVRVAFALPVTDTQNGFKAFSAHAAEQIFSRVSTQRWAFDIEVLAIAKQLSFVILEVPIEWLNDQQSRMTAADALRMGFDLFKVARRFVVGRPRTVLRHGRSFDVCKTDRLR